MIIRVQLDDAQSATEELFETLGPTDIQVWETDLRALISQFLPRRRKHLLQLLDVVLDASRGSTNHDSIRSRIHIRSSEKNLTDELSGRLHDLSDSHLFQWATYYRDTVFRTLDNFLTLDQNEKSSTELHQVVRQIFHLHAKEIYGKGFAYVSTREGLREAIAKSLNGFARFLEIPIEYYTAKVNQNSASVNGQALRALVSAVSCGIASGYGDTAFSDRSGAQLMANNLPVWGHTIGYLTAEDLTDIINLLPSQWLKTGLSQSVHPLALVIDHHSHLTSGVGGLPSACSYVSVSGELDLKLSAKLPGKTNYVEAVCFVGPGVPDIGTLTGALDRGASIVVAALPDGYGDAIDAIEGLPQVLVRTDPTYSSEEINRNLHNLFRRVLYQTTPNKRSRSPLSYNFAERFPLQDPHLIPHFHVNRPSVQDLQRTFERRNGIRLWCSVRRSGKTQAGIDLGTYGASSSSVLITQTCDDTDQIPGGGQLFRIIAEALDANVQIKGDFFRSVVHSVAPPEGPGGERCVLVLDEYETLFGRMRTAMEEAPSVRYRVVQPLLNQIVAFARSNLVVFMGQQPTAHHIIMDQNQLAPYVLQEQFPLFVNATGDLDEFGRLLSRIVTERVRFTAGFKNAVFEETAGHPFLTVNLMVHYFDWLIDQRHPASRLSFDRPDFESFVDVALKPEAVVRSQAFTFFRDAVLAPALSSAGKRSDPWLFAVYSCMRGLVLEGGLGGLDEGAFDELARRLIPPESGISPVYLLNTAVASNFLAVVRGRVVPRIRLLGRIASVSAPGC